MAFTLPDDFPTRTRAQRAISALAPALSFLRKAQADGEPWAGEVYATVLAASVLLEKADEPAAKSTKRAEMRRAVRGFLTSESMDLPALTWRDEMAELVVLMRHAVAHGQGFLEEEGNGEEKIIRSLGKVFARLLLLSWKTMPLTRAKVQGDNPSESDLANRIRRLLRSTPTSRWYSLSERTVVALLCSAGLGSKAAHRLIVERDKMPSDSAVFGEVRKVWKDSGKSQKTRKRGTGKGSGV